MSPVKRLLIESVMNSTKIEILKSVFEEYYNGYRSPSDEKIIEFSFRVASRLFFMEREAERQFPVRERMRNLLKKRFDI